MPATKVVVLGAASASFGLGVLSALLSSSSLRGSTIAMVDINESQLELMRRVIERMNRAWDAQMTLTAHTHYAEALHDACFIVSALETPPREKLWRMDYEIALRHGFRQPLAENGGPGGFAHAARNIGPVLEIVREMERRCPAALFINFSNPMMRICDTIARYSSIKVVGLCHQIHLGYAMAAKVLANDLDLRVPEGFTSSHVNLDVLGPMIEAIELAVDRLDVKAAWINHFTWMLDLRDKQNGADLYPLFARRWETFDPSFEPLTRRMYALFGLFPVPGDEHLSEYVPWVSNPVTRPWEKYDLELYEWERWAAHRVDDTMMLTQLAEGSSPIDLWRRSRGDGSIDVIEAVVTGENAYHNAVNLPNRGQIANLPMGAIVETPAVVGGAGIQAITMGSLPGPIAELCRREITVAQLCVDAVVQGDRQAALQCLLLDPIVNDIEAARDLLDDYLTTYREFLPQFWRSSIGSGNPSPSRV